MEDGGWRMEDGGWRMEDGGWRPYEMVLRYAHLAPEHLHTASSRIIFIGNQFDTEDFHEENEVKEKEGI